MGVFVVVVVDVILDHFLTVFMLLFLVQGFHIFEPNDFTNSYTGDLYVIHRGSHTSSHLLSDLRKRAK